MPLTPTDPEPDDLDSLAARFWQHHDRFVGSGGHEPAAGAPDPAETGSPVSDDELAEAEERVTDLFDLPAERDDVALALVFARRNDGSDLDALGDGIIGDAVRAGDSDLLLRLRHGGVPARLIAAIARRI